VGGEPAVAGSGDELAVVNPVAGEGLDDEQAAGWAVRVQIDGDP
jgi:hypothetical protein